jgi:hypothetical protein
MLQEGLGSAKTAFPPHTYEQVAHNLGKVLLKDLNCCWEESSTYDGKVHRDRMNRQVGVHPVLVMASFFDPWFKNLKHLVQNDAKVKVWEDI